MRITALVAVVTLAFSVPAAAQFWTDNLDAYNPGSLCPAPTCANAGAAGGWDAWDASIANAGLITTAFARSAPNSLQITNNLDEVYPFILNNPGTFPTAGVWRLTLYQYLDSATFVGGSGLQYVILNNAYAHGGPYQWCLQLTASPTSNLVTDVDRPSAGQPVILDQWVEIRIEMDIDLDCMATYYGGGLVSSGSFQVSAGYGGPPVQLANLDLFAPAGTTVAYYDDLTLTQLPGPLFQVNSAAASLDIDGVQTPGCSAAITAKTQNTAGVLNLSSTLLLPYDVGIVLVAAVPSISGGILTPGGQAVNIDLAHTSLVWLNSGTALPNLLPFPGPASLPFVTPGATAMATAQMIILDPASLIDSFTLSQAAQLTVN